MFWHMAETTPSPGSLRRATLSPKGARVAIDWLTPPATLSPKGARVAIDWLTPPATLSPKGARVVIDWLTPPAARLRAL